LDDPPGRSHPGDICSKITLIFWLTLDMEGKIRSGARKRCKRPLQKNKYVHLDFALCFVQKDEDLDD